MDRLGRLRALSQPVSGWGVPLLYQFDASGLSFTMEATSFGVPGDGDFTLPSPAQRP